jgi:hypothetical protein
VLLGNVHGPLSPAHQALNWMCMVWMCLPGTAGRAPAAQYLSGEEPCKGDGRKAYIFDEIPAMLGAQTRARTRLGIFC